MPVAAESDAVATPAAVEPVVEVAAEPIIEAAEPVAEVVEAAGAEVAAEPVAELEDKEIEIWRPGRADRNRSHDHRGEHNKPDHRSRGRGHGHGAPHGDAGRPDRPPRQDRPADAEGGERGNRPRPPRDDRRPAPPQGERPPRRDKPVDPTSPFAALAALKASLEQNKKK